MAKLGAPSKYHVGMLKRVIEYMGEGASKIELAADIGVCIDTIKQWQNPESDQYNKDFSAAIKKGEALSAAWWMEQGRLNLENREFSPTLWYMNMRNRHGWADKQETKTTLLVETPAVTMIESDRFKRIIDGEVVEEEDITRPDVH